MANDFDSTPLSTAQNPDSELQKIETGRDEEGIPTSDVQRENSEESTQEPNVYSQDIAPVEVSPTEKLQVGIDTQKQTRIRKAAIPKANPAVGVHMATEEKKEALIQGKGRLTPFEKAVLGQVDSLEEAALITNPDNPDYYADNSEASMTFGASQTQRENQEAPQLKYLTPDEIKRADERGVSVADLASVRELNESEGMWYRAKAEVYDKQIDFLKDESNRGMDFDFTAGNYWEATGVDELDHIIGSARSGVNTLEGYGERLDEQIALKINEGQLSPRAIDAQRTVVGIELEKERQFKALSTFMDLAKDYGLSDEQIRQRSQVYEAKIISLDQQLEGAVEIYKDVPGLFERFKNITDNRQANFQEMLGAFTEFGDSPNVVKGSWDAVQDTVSYGLDVFAFPFQYTGALYHSMQGTSNYDMFQNIEKYSDDIANLTSANYAVGRSYQNERILRDGEENFAHLINQNKGWLFDIEKAFNEGSTAEVGTALATLTLGSIGDFLEFAVKNPVWAAGETTKVATELMLPGTTVKAAGFAGKGLHAGLKVNRDFNKIKKAEKKNLDKKKAAINARWQAEMAEIRNKYPKAPEGTPPIFAAVHDTPRRTRGDNALIKRDVEIESANARKQMALQKATDEKNAALAPWDKVQALGKGVQSGTLMFQAAQEGLNIYNSALQDYMRKTGGKMPTLEERNQLMAYASLGGFVDYLSDRFLVGGAGVLRSFLTKPRPAGGGLTRVERDQYAKGLTNRLLRSSSVPIRSTLVKAKKMVPPKVRKKALNPAAKIGAAGVGLVTAATSEGLTEGIQSDLEINLANYVLGEDREEGGLFEAYHAGAIGFMAGGGMRSPRTAMHATKPLVGLVKDTTSIAASPIVTGFSVARTLTEPAAKARVASIARAPLDKVGRVGGMVKRSVKDHASFVGQVASTAGAMIEHAPPGKATTLALNVKGKAADTYSSAKYALSLMGVGSTGSGAIFYNLKKPIEAIKNFDISNPEILNAAASNTKEFIKQTQAIIVQVKDPEVTTKALENLNAVKVHLMDTLTTANPKEKLQLFKNLREVLALQDKLKKRGSKSGKAAIANLKKFYEEQKAKGVTVENIKPDMAAVKAVTRYFRSGMQDEDIDAETFDVLTTISINSQDPALFEALSERIAQAKVEGAFRKEFSGGKQTENTTPEAVRNAILTGSKFFVGVDEYINEIKRILETLVTNAKGNVEILKQNRIVWVANFTAVQNFIREHFDKHNILEDAIAEFEESETISEDTQAKLDSIGVEWQGLNEAKFLLNEIKKDLVGLNARQHFLIQQIEKYLGSVLAEDEKPKALEIPTTALTPVDTEPAVAVDEKEEELNDVANILDILGIKGSVTEEASVANTFNSATTLLDQLISGAPFNLANAFNWVSTEGREFEGTPRRERATSKVEERAKKAGITSEQFYGLQLLEEVYEFMLEDVLSSKSLKGKELHSFNEKIAIQKAILKTIRFGKDTVIKDGVNKGKTNLAVLEEVMSEPLLNINSTADLLELLNTNHTNLLTEQSPSETVEQAELVEQVSAQETVQVQQPPQTTGEEAPAGIESTQAPDFNEAPPGFENFGLQYENVPEEFQDYSDGQVDDILWDQLNQESQAELQEDQEKYEEQLELDGIAPLEEVLANAIERESQGAQTQEDKELLFRDLLTDPKKIKAFIQPYKEQFNFKGDWNTPTSLKSLNKGKTPKSLQQYIYEKGGIYNEGGEFKNYPRLNRKKPGNIKGDTAENNFDHWVEHLKQTSYWQQGLADQAKDDLEALQLHLDRTFGIGSSQQFADNGGLHTIYPAEFTNAAMGKYLDGTKGSEFLSESLGTLSIRGVPDVVLARAIFFDIPLSEAVVKSGLPSKELKREQQKRNLERQEADRKAQQSLKFPKGTLGSFAQSKLRATLPSKFEDDKESISIVNQYVEFYKAKSGLLSEVGLSTLYGLNVVTEEDIKEGRGLGSLVADDPRQKFVYDLIQRVYNQTYTNFSGDMVPVIKKILGEDISSLGAQPLKGTNLNFSRYFIDDSNHLPKEFIIAITLGITDYLLNFDPQRASIRTSEDIGTMFGLDYDSEKGGKGERVPTHIEERYKDVGAPKVAYVKTLGKEVWKYLGMSEIRQDDFKFNFELLFGNLALAALDDMGILEKDTTSVTMKTYTEDKAIVFNHNKSKDQSAMPTEGIEAKGFQTFYRLKTVKPESAAYNAESAKRLEGTSTLANIYGYLPIDQRAVDKAIEKMLLPTVLPANAKKARSIAELQAADKKAQEMVKAFKEILATIYDAEVKFNGDRLGAKFTFQNLLYSASEQRLPTTKPRSQTFQEGLTNIPADNITNQKVHDATAHNLNEYLVGVLEQLYINPNNAAIQKMFKQWFGWRDVSTMVEIEAEIESQQGVNNTIEGDLDKLVGFLSWLKQNDIPWKDTQYFLSNTFQPSLRLQTTDSAIDTLGSKIHRAFLQLEGNPLIPKDLEGRTKKDQAYSFFYKNAVLQKSGVQKDLTTEEEINDLFDNLLPQLTEIVEAFEYLTTGVTNQTLTTQEEANEFFTTRQKLVQDFLDKDADSPSAGLEVLSSELARKNATKKKFKTYMNTARDGISSGLFLGVHYLNGAGKGNEQGVAEVVKMMGGFTATTSEQDLRDIAQANKPDGYVIVAYQFLKHLRQLAQFTTDATYGFDKEAGDNVFKSQQAEMANAMRWMFHKAFDFNLNVLDDFKGERNQRQKDDIRKLMKHDVIAKIFGQGSQGSARGIRNWMIKGAHKYANNLYKEKVAAEAVKNISELARIQQDVLDLNRQLNKMAGKRNQEYITYENLDKTNLRKFGSFMRDTEEGGRFFTPQTIFDDANTAVLFNFADYRDIINNTVGGQVEIFRTLFNSRVRLRSEQYSNRMNKEVNGVKVTKFDNVLMGLPASEIKLILDELADVVFRFRTPLASKDPKAREGIQLFDLKLVRDTSKFTKKSSGFNLGVPQYEVIFKPTGVTIGMIHSTEAGIASIGTTVNPVVSTHDSQTVTLQFTDEHTEAINEITYKMLNNFDIWDEFVQGMQHTAKPTSEAVNFSLVNNLLSDQEILDLALNMYQAVRPKNANTFNRLYEDPTQIFKEVKKLVRSLHTPEEVERIFAEPGFTNPVKSLLMNRTQYRSTDHAISDIGGMASKLPPEVQAEVRNWLNEFSSYNTWRKESITKEKMPVMLDRFANYILNDLQKIESPTFTGEYTGIYHYANMNVGYRTDDADLTGHKRQFVKRKSTKDAPSNMVAINGTVLDDTADVFEYAADETTTGNAVKGSSVYSETSIFNGTKVAETRSETPLTADNLDGLLQGLQNTGDRVESASNMEHLRNIMSKLSTRIEDVRLLMHQSGTIPAVGIMQVTQTGTDIYLNAVNNQNMNNGYNLKMHDGVPMSGAEVLAHEVIHAAGHNLIDSNTRSVKQIRKLWKVASKLVKPEDLIPEGLPHDEVNLAAAQNTWNKMFEPKSTRSEQVVPIGESRYGERKYSDHIHEFVSIVWTNEQARKALTNLDYGTIRQAEIDQIDAPLARFKEQMTFWISEYMNKILSALDNRRFNPYESNLNTQFENLMDDLFAIQSRQNTVLFNARNRVAGEIQTVAQMVRVGAAYGIAGVKEHTFVGDMTDFVGRKYREAFETILDKDLSNGAKISSEIESAIENIIIQTDFYGIEELLSEIQGTTDRNRFASDLIRLRNQFEAKERQEVMRAVHKLTKAPFADSKGKVDPEVAKNIFDVVLKTDLAALLSSSIGVSRTRKEFNDYVSSLLTTDENIHNEIAVLHAKLDRVLQTHPEYSNALKHGAQNIGYSLIHHSNMNATRTDSVTGLIRNLALELEVDMDFDIEQAKFLVDQLATLEALSGIDSNQKQSILQLVREHSQKEIQEDGIHNIVAVNKILQLIAKDNGEIFDTDLYFRKGYFKEVTENPDLVFEIAEMKDAAPLYSRLFEQSGVNMVRDGIVSRSMPGATLPNETQHIFVTRFSSKTTEFQEAAFSIAAPSKGRGASIVPSTNPNPDVLGEIEPSSARRMNLVSLVRDRNADLKTLAQTPIGRMPSSHVVERSPMQANVFVSEDKKTGKAEVFDFKQRLNWEQKRKVSKVKQDPFETLAHTVGNHVSKTRGRLVNKVVVQDLIADYAKNVKAFGQDAYIFVAPHETDRQQQERWAMLPEATRHYIKTFSPHQEDGTTGIYVRRDVVNSIFGYRKISVRNLVDWMHDNPEENEKFKELLRNTINTQLGQLGFRSLVGLEDIMADLTNIVKDSVVVKSILVNVVNITSNTIQLVVRGMSISDAISLQMEASIEGTKYSRDAIRRRDIKFKLNTVDKGSNLYKSLKVELAEVEDNIARNPVAFLIESGAMQTHVEDLEPTSLDRNLNRKPLTRLGHAALDVSPKWVNSFFSQGIMAEDTMFYLWANNAVKLSDFAARYAYIKHLEKTTQLPLDRRVRKAMDEFVDYDIPTSQWVQYGNDIGMLWFTKYGLRTMGVAASLVVNHPGRVSMLFLGEHLFGETSTVLDLNPGGRIGNVFDRADGVEKIAPWAATMAMWDEF